MSLTSRDSTSPVLQARVRFLNSPAARRSGPSREEVITFSTLRPRHSSWTLDCPGGLRMKLYRLFTVTAAAVALTTTVSAQGKGAGAAKAPNVAASAHKGGGQTTHGPKTGTSKGSGKSANAGSSKKPATSHAKASTSTSSGSGSSTTPTDGTTATADAAPPNPVSTKITNNPAQLAKIQPQLDALGLTLEEATAGFRNQGQFIAALNAAKNRNLDFVALQEAMTVEGLSLGQAAKKVANTPPEPETPPSDSGSTGTGSTGTGSTGTGSTGTATGQAQ